jgi:hypothetical protein
MWILLARIYLLVIATSASAEGTWKLWMMGASSPWDSVGTFPARAQCVEAMHKEAQANREAGAQGDRGRIRRVIRRNRR